MSSGLRAPTATESRAAALGSPSMGAPRVSRRELLVVTAAAAVTVGFSERAAARVRSPWRGGIDFAALGHGDGWPGWTCHGVANLRRGGGLGMLEAGSDVFPYDPWPGGFEVDRSFRAVAI